MQLNKTTHYPSFNGGFRLKNIPVEARAELPNVIKKGRQIFDNFEKQGDTFLVVRDEANAKVAKFIREKNLDFEFYPSVNTKCGLDDEKPWLLRRLLTTLNETPITTMSQLKKSFNKQKRTQYIESKCPEYTNKILKSLRINNENPQQIIKGSIVVTDKEFARKVYISPPSKLNIHYVKVKPDSLNLSSERYAIDSNGNILARFESPDAIKIFNERYNKLVIK